MLATLALVSSLSLAQPAQKNSGVLEIRNRSAVNDAKFHPDGKRVYLTTEAGIEAYDIATGDRLFAVPSLGRHLVVASGGQWIASVSLNIGMISIDGQVVVLDAASGAVKHQTAGTYADFTADGRWLITHTGYRVGHPATDLPPKVEITDLTTGKKLEAKLGPDKVSKNSGWGSNTAPRWFATTKDGTLLVGIAFGPGGKVIPLTACKAATGESAELPDAASLALPRDAKFSDDRKRYVDSFRVIDTGTGKTISQIKLPEQLQQHGLYPDCSITPDGKELLAVTSRRSRSGSDEKDNVQVTMLAGLQLFDADTGAWKRTVAEAIDVHALPIMPKKKLGSVSRLAPRFVVNPQRTHAVSYHGDGSLKVWEIATGRSTRSLRTVGHSSRIERLAFSPDGGRIASAGNDGEVIVWDAVTGKAIQSLHRAAYVADLAFRPRSNELVGVGYGMIHVWDIKAGKLVRTFDHGFSFGAVRIHPDGKSAAVADFRSGVIAILDLETGKTLHELRGHSGFVTSIAYHPGGKELMTVDQSQTLRIWNLETGRTRLSWNHGKGSDWSYRGRVAMFDRDGKRVIYVDGTAVEVFSAESAKSLSRVPLKFKNSATVQSASIHPDGSRVVLASYRDTELLEFDATTGAVLRTHENHAVSTLCVVNSPDGSRMASTGYDAIIRITSIEK